MTCKSIADRLLPTNNISTLVRPTSSSAAPCHATTQLIFPPSSPAWQSSIKRSKRVAVAGGGSLKWIPPWTHRTASRDERPSSRRTDGPTNRPTYDPMIERNEFTQKDLQQPPFNPWWLVLNMNYSFQYPFLPSNHLPIEFLSIRPFFLIGIRIDIIARRKQSRGCGKLQRLWQAGWMKTVLFQIGHKLPQWSYYYPNAIIIIIIIVVILNNKIPEHVCSPLPRITPVTILDELHYILVESWLHMTCSSFGRSLSKVLLHAPLIVTILFSSSSTSSPPPFVQSPVTAAAGPSGMYSVFIEEDSQD